MPASASCSCSDSRLEVECELRHRISAEPRRADLWFELGQLLADSDKESDRASSDSCLKRARLLDPTIDCAVSQPTLEQDRESQRVELQLSKSEPTDAFLSTSLEERPDTIDRLFLIPTTCRPLVITGGEFAGTEELYDRLSCHHEVVAFDVGESSIIDIENALKGATGDRTVLIHAPQWECRLNTLASWPNATVIWLDRDPREQAEAMAKSQLPIHGPGPWSVMRPWLVHPDGGPAALQRCLYRIERFDFELDGTDTSGLDLKRLEKIRPLRRNFRNGNWLAPEYCRITRWLWKTFASDTTIRINHEELATSPETVIARVLDFADIRKDRRFWSSSTEPTENPRTNCTNHAVGSPWS